MKKLLSIILVVAMMSAVMVFPVFAENEDAVLTIVPNVTTVDASENAVDVVYTLTVKPKTGVKIGAFSVKLNPPADMTLAETEVMEQGGDGFWINFDLMYIPRFQPNGIFETAYEYAPAIKTLNAAGGTEARAMTAEAVVMTIKATIAGGKSGEFVLDADFTVADPLGNGVTNVKVESTPVAIVAAHTHEWSETWSKDAENHWKTCSGCAEVNEKAAHTWNAGEVTTPATEEVPGVKTYTCTVCGQTKTEEIPVLEHTHAWSETWSKDAENHWKTCSGCAEVNEKAAHTWNDGVVTTPATEEVPGVKTYTCTVCGQTKTEEIPVLEHTHAWSETWSKDAENHWKTCSGCAEVNEKAAHTWNAGEVTTPATEEVPGVKTYTCTVCGQTKTEEIPVISAVTLGDTDLDGDVDARDAALAYGIFNAKVNNATEQQLKNADVDGDGDVDARDAALIYAYFNGKMAAFPAE